MQAFTKTSLPEIHPIRSGDAWEIKPGQPSFTIIWMLRGKASCQVDMQQFEIGDNQLVCIRPGKFSRLQSTGCPEGYMISFTDAFLNVEERELDLKYQGGLFSIFSQCAKISVQKEIQAEMKGILEIMEKEAGNFFRYKDEIVRRYLKIFLIYLSRHSQEAQTHEDKTNSRGSEIVCEFMSLLEANFRLKRSVAEYAQVLSVTPNHLNVVVKKNTGQTAGYHIKQRLTLEAKRLIVYSNLCMKEISNELGFSDTAHFSKFFKNCSGKNFSDFKREQVRYPLYLA